MKPLLFAIMLLCAPAIAHAAEIESRVSSAIIYPQGATVTRTAAFEMEAGRTTVFILGMPQEFRRESLRVSGAGTSPFRIVATEERRAEARMIEAQRRGPRRDLEKAIKALESRARLSQNAIDAAQAQRDFIEALSAAQAGATVRDSELVSAEQYRGMWSSIGEGVKRALDAQARAEVELNDIGEQIEELRAQLLDLGAERALGPILAVEVEATEALSGQLVVDYQVGGAAWAPLYEARLQTGAQPRLSLMRRARVQQFSGEPWSDVALTLSTARPSGQSSVPKPRSLIAQLREPIVSQARVVESYVPSIPPPPPPPPPPPAAAAPVNLDPAKLVLAQKLLRGDTIEYALPGVASLAGSGNVRQLMIDEIDVDVSLERRATPSIREEAYLYALFDNAQDAPLLPGTVVLYRDDVFVGRTALELVAPGDEAKIAFGVDDRITVDHREIERMEGEGGLIRARQTERRRYETTVGNLHDAPVDLVILGSMPFTEDEDIEIELRANPEPDAFDAEGQKGALAWRFTLSPSEEKTLKHGFDLTYPAGEQLLLPR